MHGTEEYNCAVHIVVEKWKLPPAVRSFSYLSFLITSSFPGPLTIRWGEFP